MIIDFSLSWCARKQRLQVGIVTANNASVLDYRMLWRYNSAEYSQHMSHVWHDTAVNSVMFVSRDSTYGICETAAVLLLLLLSAWTVSMLATKKAQQLSSARSLTQNPGAPMKQGCANLAQMDVVTIEPNRSNLTSSPHRCWVCVHQIVADYSMSSILPILLIYSELQVISLKKKTTTNKKHFSIPFILISINI